MQTYKPDSVKKKFKKLSLPYHLSRCIIANTFYLPTLQHRTSNSYYIAIKVGLHGISSHRVYLVSLQLNLYILSVALVLLAI